MVVATARPLAAVARPTEPKVSDWRWENHASTWSSLRRSVPSRSVPGTGTGVALAGMVMRVGAGGGCPHTGGVLTRT